MLIPTIIMFVMAAILLYIGYSRGNGEELTAIRTAGKMTLELIPLLVCAFIVATMVQALVSPESIAKWIGDDSGLRGITIGALMGGLAPGGPFVSLPIAIGLMKSGASVAVMVSFITGWSVWAFNRIPLEVAILGWKLTLVRLACSVLLPFIAGYSAQFLFSHVKLQ